MYDVLTAIAIIVGIVGAIHMITTYWKFPGRRKKS